MIKTGESRGHTVGLPIKILIFMAPLLIISSLMYLKEFDYKLYRTIVKEDGLVEYLTFFNYFIAFVVGLVIAKNFWNQDYKYFFALYLFFSLFLLFVSGEEISWGQRLFKIRPPEFFLENSFQNEINLHNLKQIQNLDKFFAAKIFIIIGLFGSFFWVVLACLKPLGLESLQKLCMPYLAPQWFLAGYFLPVAIYFYYLVYLFPQYSFFNIRYREQEIMEFILSMGFLLFVVFNRNYQVSSSDSSKSRG